ncbi:RES domain-containing protein [Winogradskyella flava]|uniref:RES domain-containing protein n=1 Tax=Winogradskyella flava TaxID=1884876 RepID=UPI002490898C|nr:RES domain-containing protein [Winogradskyella flava]
MNKLTQEDIALFPDYEEYLKDLRTLESLDFGDKTSLEIYNLYYDYARILPTNFGTFSPEKFSKHTFFRARLNIDKEKEDITLAQTYSYPSSSLCKSNGRANLKYRSVFYCSNDSNTAIIETKPKIGDVGFLSVWKGKPRRNIKVGICLPHDLPEGNEWNLMAKDVFQYQIENLEPEAKDKHKHLIALYKFISRQFVVEKYPYPLTSMISYSMMFDDMWRDLIIYPSVVANSQFCNMAFHPNSVDENLEFQKVFRFKVVDMINNVPQYIPAKIVGEIKNTKMIWRDITYDELHMLGFKQTRS